MTEVKKPKVGQHVTIRFVNTHIASGRVTGIDDTAVRVGDTWWQRCMIERIFLGAK